MAGYRPAVHVVQLRPAVVPDELQRGDKFIRWDEVSRRRRARRPPPNRSAPPRLLCAAPVSGRPASGRRTVFPRRRPVRSRRSRSLAGWPMLGSAGRARHRPRYLTDCAESPALETAVSPLAGRASPNLHPRRGGSPQTFTRGLAVVPKPSPAALRCWITPSCSALKPRRVMVVLKLIPTR